MTEQQPIQFYDKLLHYLNRTYATNIRTQELYLDLKKHRRNLRFNSIRNIYSTLTEGKADQVIYSKQKHSLLKNNSFNPKFTESICWRLIEKLINKVAYYLMNQKKLECLTPSILKTLHFIRNAPEKASHKTAFLQFFSEIIDTLITENNLLEYKIYQLLIQRGYIHSIDEFYRMSRFQGPDVDFTYTNQSGQQQDHFSDNVQQSLLFPVGSIKINRTTNMEKSKKRMVSIRKFVHTRNKSDFGTFNIKLENWQGLPKIEQNAEENESLTESEEQSGQQIQDTLKYNKIVHNIHNQVEKIVDQIMNHKDFELMIPNTEHMGNKLNKNGDRQSGKQPALRQVLRNLKIKNFQANQTLITMNQGNGQKDHLGRKNSKAKVSKQLKSGRGVPLKNNRNRASIATALSSRLKQKVLLSSGFQQIKQLIVQNLGNLQDKKQDNQNTGIINLRKNKRLQTQVFEVNFEQHSKNLQRRSSNLNFLRNAFVFNSDQRGGINNQYSRDHRYADLLDQSQVSSQNASSTLKTIISQQGTKKRYQNNNQSTSNDKKTLFTNEKIATVGRFGRSNRCGHVIEKKNVNKGNKNFNTTLLELAVKKYHRCQTQQSKIKNLQELLNNFQTPFSFKEELKQQELLKNILKKKDNPYMHHRKYQTFDRIKRRVF